MKINFNLKDASSLDRELRTPILQELKSLDLESFSKEESEKVNELIYAFDLANEPDITSYDFSIEMVEQEKDKDDKSSSIPFSFEVIEGKKGEHQRHADDEEKYELRCNKAFVLFGQWYLPNYASDSLKQLLGQAVAEYKALDRSGVTHDVVNHFDNKGFIPKSQTQRFIGKIYFSRHGKTL